MPGPRPQVPGHGTATAAGVEVVVDVHVHVLAVPVGTGRALRGGDDLDRRPGRIRRPLGAGHHHRAGPVVLHAAVEEVERLGHQARGEVVVDRHRSAHHRPRVAGGVVAEAHRHVAQLFARRAEPVHVALHDHGVGDGRTEHPERHRERGRACRAAPSSGAARRAGARPGAGAPAPGPWPNRWNCPWHRLRYTTTARAWPASTASAALADRGAAAAPAGQPAHRGVAQLRQPEVGGHEHRQVAVVGERRQSVDLVQVHAGIGHGRADGLQRPAGTRWRSARPAWRRPVSPTPTMQARLTARPRRVPELGQDLVGVLAESSAAVGRSGTATRRPRTARPAWVTPSISTQWPAGLQVAVVERLVGGADHAPGQAGLLTEPEELLAVVALGQPGGRGHQLAVVARPVARILEGGIRQRSGHAVGLEHRAEVLEHVWAEEVGHQRGDLLAVPRGHRRDGGSAPSARRSRGRS